MGRRHDEQESESHYDDRSEAEDDVNKGKIRFPQEKLFGRDVELEQLTDIYNELLQPEGESKVVFLDGYSGVGKSALVEGLVQRLEQEQSLPLMYAFGKYNEHVSGDPFSAFVQAINQLADDMVREAHDGEESELLRIRSNLKSAGYLESEEASLLLDIVPSLSKIFQQDKGYSAHRGRVDIKQLSYVFGNFLRILCTQERPLLLFLDDLQWVDPASLELLGELLADTSIRYLLFIGSYRTDQVDYSYLLDHQVKELQTKRSVQRIHISNLSPVHLSSFIAETLDLRVQDVDLLAELIYSKTLGNIFFCRQAMEELARKNAIYYDVMLFQWQFNVDGQDLKNLLGDDVVQIVQAKLKSLPIKLRRTLVLAAFIRHSIDPRALLACLRYDGYQDMDERELEKLLQQGAEQGLLFKSSSGCHTYKFAHDRVQEAAYTSIPLGSPRYQLLGRIGKVLVETADSSSSRPEDEWMLFVAAEHFSSVPLRMVPDTMQLLKLNFRVGVLCLEKASFEQAVQLFRAAASCVDKSMWQMEYDFSLKLFNRLLETEFALGNYDETKSAIGVVLKSVSCPKDKSDAHYTRIAMAVKINNQNHELGVSEGAKLLSRYGQTIPLHPTKGDILRERVRLKIALGTRPISVLADLPEMKNDWIVKLLSQLCFLANLAHNVPLNIFACVRAIRVSVEEGASKYLPVILTQFSVPFRTEGKFRTAYSYAAIVTKLYDRFPGERGGEYCTSRMILHSGILHLKQAFHESINAFLANYITALVAGNVEISLCSAMHFPFIYFASGLPLNAVLEPKLILFEGKAKQLSQPGFLAIFQICRQFLYNLQGKSAYPTKLKGDVLDEDEVLKKLDGNIKKMTLRDLSIFRLALGYIFGDEDTMELTMLQLEDYPLFDLPLVRQHLRLTFCGLAALTLGRRNHDKGLTNRGYAIMKELRKLDQIGSANAHPAYLCLRAVDKHKRGAYDEAIAACASARLMHLEAMMSEQCGILLLEKNKQDLAQDYLARSLWLFHDWGAQAKVQQLSDRFEYLRNVARPGRSERRTSLSTFLLQASRCGLKPDATNQTLTKPVIQMAGPESTDSGSFVATR